MDEKQHPDRSQHMFSDERLYGDDFSYEDIAAWYRDEEKGYAGIASARGGHSYSYRGLDDIGIYSRCSFKKGSRLLGLGAADGSDYEFLSSFVSDFTIVEIAEEFWRTSLFDKPSHYVKPAIDGKLPFLDGSFDIVTAFSVLHHIPNVTFVMAEMYRVLKPGGMLLLREPIVTMGDWRVPRRGLTGRERGLPLKYIRRVTHEIGFKVASERACVSPIVRRAAAVMGLENPYNRAWIAHVDLFLSRMFSKLYSYHPRRLTERLGPQAIIAAYLKPEQ